MVMGQLNKKIIRDMRQMKGQFIAIIIVILVGAFFYGGMTNFARNLEDYADNYFDTSNLADLWLYYSEVSQTEIDAINGINGVAIAEGRTVVNAYQNIDTIKATLRVQTLTENINKVTLLDGEVPYGYGSVGIDADYANAHGLQLGDSMIISVDDVETELTISGFLESSEHIIKSRNSSDYPPNHSQYGIAYVTVDTLAGFTGHTEYNEVLVDATGTERLEDIENQVEVISSESNNTYLYALQRQANMSYQQFTDEIEAQNVLAKILPIIFYAAAALITYIIMSRIVDAQRTQIGAMKAIGAKGRLIALHYVSYALIIGMIGGLIGSILGVYLYPNILMKQSTSILTMPNLEITIDFRYVLEALLFSVIFGVVACYISVRKNLKENPAQAMRAKPYKSMKPIFLERIKAFWNHLKYTDKLIMRNIFTHKIRATFSVAGILFCVALLIMATSYLGSRTELVNRQYAEVYNYDLRVAFLTPLDSIELPDFDDSNGMNASEMAQTDIVITNLADKRTINLIALSNDQQCIKNFDSNGNLLTLDDSTVVISERYAETHQLSVGDDLRIKLINPKYEGISFDVIIGGISVQYLNQEIYCTFGLLESNGLDLEPNTLLYQIEKPSSIGDIYRTFTEMDAVKEVKTISDLQAQTERGLENLLAMMIIIIMCAVLLAIAAIYSISTINIQERYRELATLKVLGCQRSKLNNMIFKENMILTVIAIILGVPLGVAAYLKLLKAFTLDSMVFPVYLTAHSILWPVATTLVTTVICNFILRHKLKKIDMIESLKANE